MLRLLEFFGGKNSSPIFSKLVRARDSNLTIYNPLDFNSTVDTLQRSFFHAHANEWIIMQGVFPESWCVKVCCIYLFRCPSWIFQQKKYVWKRVFLGWSSEMKYCLLHFDRFQSIKVLINFESLQLCNCHLTHIATGNLGVKLDLA